MLDICLLGTSGMMPLPNRWLTSMLARYNGSELLIDCGEGTQIALKKTAFSPKPIDVICITHFHADHISGLPGMLLAMANADRTEKLTIIGPKGLERVVTSLRVIVPELPFEIEFVELSEAEEVFKLNGYTLTAFKVNHRINCYGYSIQIDRAGRFDAARAKELGLPVNLWNKLQKGEEQEFEGEIYTPEMVMGPARKGLKVTYCTDSRPTPGIVSYAEGSDLFICEGMYGEEEKFANALEHKHMMMREAAQMAADASVSELWYTHFSPSMAHPENYLGDMREIFKNAQVVGDGKYKELRFEGE